MPLVTFTGPGGAQQTLNIPDGLNDAQAREHIRASLAASGNVAGQQQAARIGGPIIAGLAAAPFGGSGLAAIGIQGSIAGIFSLANELSNARTPEDIDFGRAAADAGIAAATVGAFNVAGRIFGGARSIMAARAGRAPVTFPRENVGGLSQATARASGGGLGLNAARQANQRLVNVAAARAAGVPGSMVDDVARAGFDEDTLAAARSTVNALYD